MDAYMNQGGRTLPPGLICPVTGLKVASRPEWIRQRVSDTMVASFYVIGGAIIYSLPEGFADLQGVRHSFALNEVVAESITSVDGHFIQIEDYAALKGLSQAARRYATSQMTANRRIQAFIFCNLSPLLSIAVKIGSRFNASDKPVYVEGQYRDAIARAFKLCETSLFASGALVLGRKTCIDDTSRSLSPIEVFSNDSWNIRTTKFSNDSVIIDRCIHHAIAEGGVEPEHVPMLEKMRYLFQAELPSGCAIEYVIINASRLNRGNRQGRIAFLESLKKWNSRFPLRAYILYHVNAFMHTAALLARPFLPFNVEIVQDLDQAFQFIKEDRQRARSTQPPLSPAAKVEDPNIRKIEQLLTYIGGIKWDKAGVDIPIEITADDPFYVLFQSIKLIKDEIDDLFAERKRLEKKLLESQKMEAVGTLAGGIAHDFNNLLMGIQGRASLLSLRLDPAHPYMEHIDAIEECIRSATNLTKQLLGFARGGKYEVRPLDINELLLGSATMFGRTKKEIRIHTNLKKPPPVVAADRSQLEQVFLNLYINAWQAMPDGGDLHLDTGIVTLDEQYCSSCQAKPGHYAKVSVTDTGIGMDASIRQRIFDPFFTTKKMGRGTGLGLASAYGIIKNHEGIITVYSEPGHGSTFTIYLPLLEGDVWQPSPSEKQLVEGAETILLVDDEEMIIGVGKALLEELGYHVIVAKNGERAVDAVARNGHDIQLVILDLIMPGMDGGKTFDRIRELQPLLPVILSSGYSLNGQANAIMERGCSGFIQKPFNIYELSEQVRRVLDQRNATEER
jgi:signal transduction histidine kinase/CheY-like chemotaxis protein